MAITQDITALPAAPNRQSDTPDQFSNKADAFVAGQVSMVTEINTWADQANTTQTEINTSQTAAAGSATASANSATASANSATDAQQSADAAAVAAAAAGEDFISTSTTTATLGTGSKTLTVDTGKAYAPGLVVRAVETANPTTKYLVGTIVSYNSSNGELVFTATSFQGTGSVSAWTISINTVDAYSKTETDDLISESGVGRLFKPAVGALTASQLVALAEDGSGVEGLENTPTAFGTAANLATNAATRLSVCRLTDSTFVVAYADSNDSNKGKAVVATAASNGDVTYGTVQEFSNATTVGIRCVALSSTLFALAYTRSSVLYCNAGEVSGTAISFESGAYEESMYSANVAENVGITRLSDTSFAAAYNSSGSTGRSRAASFDTSANSTTLGSEVVFNGGTTDFPDIKRLNATKFVVVYRDRSDSNQGTAIVGSYSGTTLSYGGTEEHYGTSGSTTDSKVVRLTDSKVLISYIYSGNVYAKVGTVSGDAITFGSQSNSLGTSSSNLQLSNISATSAAIIHGADEFVPLLIDGDTVTPATASATGLSIYAAITALDGERYAIAGTVSGSPNTPRSFVATPAYDNTSRWLGFSRAAYANGATAEVLKLGDMVGSLSSLAANTTYYIDTATAALTTSNASGIKVGKALDTTSLLITGGND